VPAVAAAAICWHVIAKLCCCLYLLSALQFAPLGWCERMECCQPAAIYCHWEAQPLDALSVSASCWHTQHTYHLGAEAVGRYAKNVCNVQAVQHKSDWACPASLQAPHLRHATTGCAAYEYSLWPNVLQLQSVEVHPQFPHRCVDLPS
jgi:hypothetical protein